MGKAEGVILGGIIGLTQDGFNIGQNADTNTNGVTYY
jgi:hypothetical protein